MIATLPVSIAGWGVRESSFMFAFAHAGLAQSDGLAISILFGAASFVAGLVGGIVWIAYGLHTPKSMAKPYDDPGRLSR